MDIIDDVFDGDTYSDAETIPYPEPYIETSKKDKIYIRKAKKNAIKILNKKRKLKAVADSSDEEDNPSDAETIPYAEPYRDTFTKKDKIYRKKSKRKAIKTLTRKKKTLPKNTKIIKVVEPKENDDLEITGFKSISHPRTRKQLKEKAVARANSAAVQSNLGIDIQNLVEVPLLFNLFIVRNIQTISEAVRANAFINPEEYLNVPLRFDLDETRESEIEKWIVKSIKYWITRNADSTRYYIDHADGSDLFIIRRE